MLLIMGLGVQMLGWDEEFCEMLAARGFRVVRFDNRDVGRSTKIEGGLGRTWWRRCRGDLQLGELHARGHGRRLRRACWITSGSRRRTWWAPRRAA